MDIFPFLWITCPSSTRPTHPYLPQQAFWTAKCGGQVEPVPVSLHWLLVSYMYTFLATRVQAAPAHLSIWADLPVGSGPCRGRVCTCGPSFLGALALMPFFFFFYNQISTWLHGDLSYSFGYIRNLSVSSWFSVWIVPCVDGFLMWLWGVGEAELHILLLCHLDPPLKCISLAVYLGVELRIQGIPVFNLLNLTFSFPNWL